MAEAPHRLFIAIPVPEATRDACRALIEPVRTLPYGRYARWVHLDTLHVTLRFLGDTPPERVPDVAEAVRDAVGARTAFEVGLGGAGTFPAGGHKIRALWLGIVEGAAELGAIVDDLGPALIRAGYPEEPRPFRPHLTVARTDRTGIRDAALIAQALEAAAEGWTATFTADRVVLFRSHLGGGPPRHEPVDEIALRAPEG